MKNKFSDLNDHLFAQLERLGDEEMKPEQLALEIDRSRAIALISNQIVSAGTLVLKAQIAIQENQLQINPNNLLLGNEK